MTDQTPTQTATKRNAFYRSYAVKSSLIAVPLLTAAGAAFALDVTPLTTELESAQSGIETVIGLILLILAVILGFSYFKRGAK
ncbi:MAG: major capsid protein [Pseudomonadota bacterium]|nr:major capsid protein [Pseudomonadota bacterium]